MDSIAESTGKLHREVCVGFHSGRHSFSVVESVVETVRRPLHSIAEPGVAYLAEFVQCSCWAR
eukprot:1076166-Lingulodinium_polyedra.AAC.1